MDFCLYFPELADKMSKQLQDVPELRPVSISGADAF
jgi:hypothetical protein